MKMILTHVNPDTLRAAEIRQVVGDETEALRVLRKGMLAAIAFLAVYLLAGVYGGGRENMELLLNAAALLVAVLFMGLTFASGFSRHREPATFVFCIVLIALFIRSSAIASDVQPRFLAILFCPVAAASFAGWEPRWQGALNVACLAGFLAAEFVVPIPDSYARYRLLWILVALAAAQASATLLDRRKQTLRAQHKVFEDAAEQRERQIMAVAHDIRSPLAAVSGFLSLLQDTELSDQDQSKMLSRMGSVTRRMELLVDNLMELGRLDTGRLEPRGRMAKPDAIAAEVARAWAEEANNKGTVLRTELGCESSPQFDGAYLERIFTNLLANAVVRTDAGEIRLKTAMRGGRLAIEVSDSGSEVGASEGARMFDRPDSYDSAAGVIRLGLYVARALVEAHGGRIEARPSTRKGLSVSAEIPVEPGPRLRR